MVDVIQTSWQFLLQHCNRPSQQICWITWAVATPGASGVGRLKAAQSGVATAQKSSFSRPNPTFRRHSRACISEPCADIAVKMKVKIEVKMGFSLFPVIFHPIPLSQDKSPTVNCRISVP